MMLNLMRSANRWPGHHKEMQSSNCIGGRRKSVPRLCRPNRHLLFTSLKMTPNNKAEAKRQGLTRYDTGSPCKFGHISPRMTSNGACVTCLKSKLRKWKTTGAGSLKMVLAKAAWRDQNRAHLREKNRERFLASPNLKKWYDANRRARKLVATPRWADKAKIKEIYMNCPDGMHVDHVVPLAGKNVCGLHVHFNLQYLTGDENHRKGNSFSG